jgi:Prokaryotic E2 family E
MDWVEDNLALLRTAYPDLEYRLVDGVHWVGIPSYRLPEGIWTLDTADVAFRIPATAGEAPYGFWVRPRLELTSGGTVNNYTYPSPTAWGEDWGVFSFSALGPWQPKVDVRAGANMLNFARAIADRLREGA